MDTQQKINWHKINLPWINRFWEDLNLHNLARLNPHWYLPKKFEIKNFEVEDAFLKKNLSISLEQEFNPQEKIWQAKIEPLGLTFWAREADAGNNTEIAYSFSEPEDENLSKWALYWLTSLREYYRLYTGKGINKTIWRFIMNKIWLPMNPTQRKISLFIFKFTFVEMVLIAAILIGYFVYIKNK